MIITEYKELLNQIVAPPFGVASGVSGYRFTAERSGIGWNPTLLTRQ